jgi:hypothetical protein
MKKASLFLSVAWLAMTVVPTEGFSSAETAAPAKTSLWGRAKAGASALKTKTGGLFKRNSAQPKVYTSGSTEESAAPAAAAGESQERPRSGSFLGRMKSKLTRSNSAPLPATTPLEQASMSPKAAEAEDAFDMKKSMTALETSNQTMIDQFKDRLNLIGKNRLGSRFSSSKKCRTWGGYSAELAAGKDFYGSNCAREFCSAYCAPVSVDKFWAEKTLGETVCAYRCARGVSMGNANKNLRAAYDATEHRPVWGEALTHWQTLEGKSVVTKYNLVNSNAQEALQSANTIATFKGVKKAAPKSESPAMKAAEASYTKVVDMFIKAVVALVNEEQKAVATFTAKTKAVEDAAKKVMDARESVSNNLSETDLEAVFNQARESALKKMKAGLVKTAVESLNHDTVNTTLETVATGIAKNLNGTLIQGEDSIRSVEDEKKKTVV